MPIKQEFSERFRRALEYSMPGASQLTRAKKLGVSQPTMSKYLSGEKVPSTERAIYFATTLRVNFEWLMTGRGPRSDKEATLDYLDLTGLPEDSKVALRATVHAIKEQASTYKTSNGH